MYFGIDLGTTNSLITYLIKIGEDNFDIKTIMNNKASRLTPSVVYFDEVTNTPVVGSTALEQYLYQPERTIRWVKRNMGTDTRYVIDGKPYSPQLISAFILKSLKNDAEKDLQISAGIKDIVITVPADFDANARQATVESAKIANFENIFLLPEPNAAILNYLFRTKSIGKLREKFSDESNFYVVFDLGGGTLDISLISISIGTNGKPNTTVISSAGDKYLGGLNFDIGLTNYLLKKALILYKKDHDVLYPLFVNAKYFYDRDVIIEDDIKSVLARIITECENGKIALSDEHKRNFTFITQNGKTFKVEISRDEFEDVLKAYFTRIEDCASKVLENACEKTNNALTCWNDLDGVLMVGGSSNIPAIKALCRSIFGKEPIDGINTFESVAMGAAIYSSIKHGNLNLLGKYSIVIPHHYGLIVDHNFYSVLHKGSDSNTGSMIYKVPFSLDTKTPIEVAQKYYDQQGNDILLTIEKINYSHPFMYTGDPLEVTFSIDDNLILKVDVKEQCIKDTIEIEIDNPARLSDNEIQLARNNLRTA